MVKQKQQNKEEIKIDDNKLLKGILLALLEDRSRENKAKILKETGFNQSEVLEICGPAESTLRVRKLREKKKNDQTKE